MLIILYVSVHKIPLDLNQQSREASVPRTNRNADYGFDAYLDGRRVPLTCAVQGATSSHLELLTYS